MRASFKLLTISCVLGVSMWACGGDDSGDAGGPSTGGSTSGSGGDAGAGATDTGGSTTTAGTMNGGSNAGTSTGGTMMPMGGANDGGTTTAMGGQMMAAGGDMTAIGGDTSMAGASTMPMAGAAPVDMGGAGGMGGEPAVVPSCKGTPPNCASLSNVTCLQVQGCSLEPSCSGTPTSCESIVDQGKCNSAPGCAPDNGVCKTTDPSKRPVCADLLTYNQCKDAGCDYKYCGGTATPCAQFDNATCSTQSGCSLQ